MRLGLPLGAAVNGGVVLLAALIFAMWAVALTSTPAQAARVIEGGKAAKARCVPGTKITHVTVKLKGGGTARMGIATHTECPGPGPGRQ